MPGAPSSAGWDVPARANYLAPFGHPIATALTCGRTSHSLLAVAENPAIFMRLFAYGFADWCIPNSLGVQPDSCQLIGNLSSSMAASLMSPSSDVDMEACRLRCGF